VFANSPVSAGPGRWDLSALVRESLVTEPQACGAYDARPARKRDAKPLSDDYLSSLVRPGLFSTAQRFLPVLIYAWDRVVTLEKASRPHGDAHRRR
jgi:hypothetical protein